MQPPHNRGTDRIVHALISENPGITFSALTIRGFWLQSELIPVLRGLEQSGLIRRDGAQFFIRQRRRKPAPGFWARIRLALFSPPAEPSSSRRRPWA